MECKLEHITVHYEQMGQGRPLLALHGFGVDHRLVAGCLEPIFAVRPGWRRFYPDLPGMGKTPGEKWITNADKMLEVILQFIDDMIPNQPFTLAAQSYGGYLARGIIHHRPDLVDGLLLLCPTIVANNAERSLPPKVALVEDHALISGLTPIEREFFEFIAVVQNQTLWERARDEILVGVTVADQAFLAHLRANSLICSFELEASSVVYDRPTLILMGRQDAIVGYRDAWKLIEQFPRSAFVILDRAGHNLQQEQEGLFNSLVNEWLDRVEEGNV